jgi:LysR family transcriptional regulator, nitrogen assimilation regulatory protein
MLESGCGDISSIYSEAQKYTSIVPDRERLRDLQCTGAPRKSIRRVRSQDVNLPGGEIVGEITRRNWRIGNRKCEAFKHPGPSICLQVNVSKYLFGEAKEINRRFSDIFKIDNIDAKYAYWIYLGGQQMDLVSLRYFIETARQRSISKAAVSLGVVQPALTRRIQMLEDKLGTELLMRHRRGVEPTEAGRIILERGELILRMSQQLETEVKSHGAETVGQVGLGFPPSIANLFIGRILSESIARYPRLELHLQEDFSPAVRDSLLAGRIDLGIMSCEAHHPDLVLQPLFDESMWLIGRPDDWNFRKGRLKPTVLNNLPVIIGSFTHTLLKRHEARLNFRLRVIAKADSLTLIREVLRTGTGFLVVPPSSVDRELASGEFVGAPLEGLSLSRGLFHHRDRPLNRASIAVKGMIDQEVQHLFATRSGILRARNIKT